MIGEEEKDDLPATDVAYKTSYHKREYMLAHKTFWYKRKILSKAQQAQEFSSFAKVTAQRTITLY